MKSRSIAGTYEDALEMVHRLALSGRVDAAVELMLDVNSMRLQGLFRRDGNHSWYVVGDLLWQEGRISEALRAFQRALRSWSGDVQAMWAIGNCYSELGKFRLAERYFRRALQDDPESAELRFNLGNSLLDQGRYEDAVAEYEKVKDGDRETMRRRRKNLKLARSRLKGRTM